MNFAGLKTSLSGYVFLTYILQVYAVIYHDFQELKSNQMLRYAILQTGANLHLVDATDNSYDFFQIKLLYKSFYSSQTTRYVQFCKNHTIYLRDQYVILDVGRKDLGFFAQCLKNSSNPEGTDLTRLTVLVFGEKIVPKEQVQILQSMGVKFGHLVYPSKQPPLIQYQKMGVTIDVVGIYAIIRDKYKYGNDYNSFVQIFDKTYNSLTQSLSGHTPQLLMATGCEGHYCDSKYWCVFARFLYQWGETNQRFVVPLFSFCSTYRPKAEFYQCIEKCLFGISSPLPSFSVKPYRDNRNASVSMLESSLNCIYFESIFIEVDDYTGIDYDYLLGLAIARSNLSCKVTLNLKWNLGKYIGTPRNQSQASNQFLLSNIARQYPDLFDKIFVVQPVRPPYDDITHREVRKLKQTIDELSKLMNTSPILLLQYDVSDVKNAAIMTTLKNFSRIFNASVSAVVDIPKTSIDINTARFAAELIYEDQLETAVLISYYGKDVDENNIADCFQFKQKWNSLKTLADRKGFHMVVKAHISYPSTLLEAWEENDIDNNSCFKPWIKNFAIFGNEFSPESATPEELQFLSNFQDTCVAMPQNVPVSPVVFNLGLAGVTFNLSSRKFSGLDSNEIADLLQLIHFKFNSIELVSKHHSLIGSLQKSIQVVKNNANFTDNGQYRYFVHISSLDKSKFVFYNQFAGVHASLCFCKNDRIILEELRNALVKNIGFSLPYEDALNPKHHDVWKNLVGLTNYVIIDLDLVEAIVIGPKSLSNQSSMNLNKTIHDYIRHSPKDILPNKVFDNLRAIRLNIKRWNPAVVVYMKLAWPTIPNTRSTERTQRMWEFVNDFSKAFNFPFFINEAFDNCAQRCTDRSDLQYGWWRLRNDRDVGNPANYVDKQAEFYDLETLRPNRTFKSYTQRTRTAYLPITEVVAGVIGFIMLIIMVATVLIYKLRSDLQMLLTKEELREFEKGKTGYDVGIPHDDDYCSIAYNKEKYEISKAALSLDSSTVVGYGNFGVVYKATIQDHDKPVAVKVPKICGKVELLSVLREIKLLSFVGEHENILKLVGAYTREVQKGIVYVITEFVENGPLLEYLRKIPNSKQGQEEVLLQLNRFCLEISKGMQYLSEKKVIHGDLSTRNVLLDSSNMCKISDFGLSRKLYYMDLYVKQTAEPVPWRWMAVEALERSELSLKTDIWSLGVTIWEIYSFAEEPYQSISWDLEFSKKLIDGLRLPKPEMADQSMYQMMLSCWKIDPDERPSPSYFIDFFQSLRSLSYTQL